MRRSAVWLVVSGAILGVGAVGAQAQRQAGGNTLVGTNVAAASSADGVRPAVAEIVARMLEKNKERTAALEHYESERTYKVEYNGTGGEHHAELQVRMVYTGPDQKRFTVESEQGSEFICDTVLRKLAE